MTHTRKYKQKSLYHSLLHTISKDIFPAVQKKRLHLGFQVNYKSRLIQSEDKGFSLALNNTTQ